MWWMKDYPICIKFLAERVQSMFLVKHDVIFRIGDINDQIHILVHGEVLATRNDSLFSQEGIGIDSQLGTSRPQESDSHSTFGIPRNTHECDFRDINNLKQVEKVFETAGRKVVHRAVSGFHMEKSLTREVEDRHEGKTKCGYRQTGNFMIDSEVLRSAGVELKREDLRRAVAARRVQRLWRNKLRSRAQSKAARLAPSTNDAKISRPGFKISKMTSKNIRAPAYFGESCLWQPIKDWNNPLPYLYTVRCCSTGEFAHISRASIHEALGRFSPWLPERLDIFREAVARQMQPILKGDAIFRNWDVATDSDIPENGLGMQDQHRQALFELEAAKAVMKVSRGL